MDFFDAAKTLLIPPHLFAFKLYSMMDRGYTKLYNSTPARCLPRSPAGFELLLLQTENFTNLFETEGKTETGREDHEAAPTFGGKERGIIHGDAEEQDLKIRGFSIAIDAGFGQIHRRTGFQINRKDTCGSATHTTSSGSTDTAGWARRKAGGQRVYPVRDPEGAVRGVQPDHASGDQIRQADARVRKLRARVQNLEALATDIARHMNGPIGHGQTDYDKTGTVTAEICDAKQELEEAEEAAREIRKKIGKMICQIEDGKITKIMLKRFLQGMKWKEIAKEMMYSEQWIYELRLKGIQEIERMLSETSE